MEADLAWNIYKSHAQDYAVFLTKSSAKPEILAFSLDSSDLKPVAHKLDLTTGQKNGVSDMLVSAMGITHEGQLSSGNSVDTHIGVIPDKRVTFVKRKNRDAFVMKSQMEVTSHGVPVVVECHVYHVHICRSKDNSAVEVTIHGVTNQGNWYDASIRSGLRQAAPLKRSAIKLLTETATVSKSKVGSILWAFI